MSWEEGRAGDAVERILVAAERVFTDRGIAEAGMAEVAQAAGCSRATLYRYFPNRRELQLAYVHREARRIVAVVSAAVASTLDPVERRVDAIVGVVAEVRRQPHLVAWLRPADAGLLRELLDSSEVVDGFVRAFLGPDASRAQGRWLLRVVLSYVALPGADPDEERQQVRDFVVPVLAASAVS